MVELAGEAALAVVIVGAGGGTLIEPPAARAHARPLARQFGLQFAITLAGRLLAGAQASGSRGSQPARPPACRYCWPLSICCKVIRKVKLSRSLVPFRSSSHDSGREETRAAAAAAAPTWLDGI